MLDEERRDLPASGSGVQGDAPGTVDPPWVWWRFLSVLPASRKEDGVFRHWVVTNRPDWHEIARRPTRDVEHPEDVVSAYEDHLPSADGHRIVWIHSSAKARRDATRRHQAIARAIAAIDALNLRLASSRCRIKTAVGAEAEAREHVAEVNASRWVHIHVEQETEESFRQAKRGRPGPNTGYKKVYRTTLRIRFAVDDTAVAHDAVSDGMWPLITNDRDLTPAELFDAYRWQPNLEKRHAQLKGTQLVAPMWLRDPGIEGLLTCHFIAMLLSSLIERTIRTAMADAGLAELSLYPEDRGCTAPTTARILEIFTAVARHELAAPDGTVLRTFHPELTDLQRQVLDLRDIPTSVYNPATKITLKAVREVRKAGSPGPASGQTPISSSLARPVRATDRSDSPRSSHRRSTAPGCRESGSTACATPRRPSPCAPACRLWSSPSASGTPRWW